LTLSPSSAEVRNDGAITSILPTLLRGVVLNYLITGRTLPHLINIKRHWSKVSSNNKVKLSL
jgi:hypothetical protein